MAGKEEERGSLYHQLMWSPSAARLLPAETPAFLPLGVRDAAPAPLLELPPVLGAEDDDGDGAGSAEDDGAGSAE